jgi:hypothetical protein
MTSRGSRLTSIYRIILVCSVLTLGVAPASCATTTYPVGSPSSSPTVNGNDLRTALMSARPGDVIALTAGATFEGPFTLPLKPPGEPITIRTSTSDSDLPTDIRVSPDVAGLMPKLVPSIDSSDPSDSVITTATGAGNYQLIGLDISTPRYVSDLIRLGTAREISWMQLPHHITIDRSYIHGSTVFGTRRGIAANGGQGTTASSGNAANDAGYPADDIVITNSFFADFKTNGEDSQAVAVWNGYGPFRFENNYFEGAGENLVFGSADPSIANLVPSNITIRQNHFHKPLSWWSGAEARFWWVKNLLALKNAQYVLIDANVFEHNWVDQLDGMGILFAPRNEYGRCLWCVVQQVVFRNNIVRHSAGGIDIVGQDEVNPSKQLKYVTIQNNLFQDINDRSWGASRAAGRLLEVADKADHVTIDHNTGLQTRAISFSRGSANTAFVFTNNVVAHNQCLLGDNGCGMSGDGASVGSASLNRYFISPAVSNNVMFSGNEAGLFYYPDRNFFPASVTFKSDCRSDPTARSFCDFSLETTDPTNASYVDADKAPLGIDGSVYTATADVVQYVNP